MDHLANRSASLFSHPLRVDHNPFHFPEGEIPGFERHLASAKDDRGRVWCALHTECGSQSGIDVFCFCADDQDVAVDNSGFIVDVHLMAF